MSQVQIITTPNGERMAILPEAEYMRLIADTDSADIDAARQARDAGDYVPAAVVNRLVGGENPLRVWREHRGMTAKALAEALGGQVPRTLNQAASQRPHSAPDMTAPTAAASLPLGPNRRCR